jgi:predicted dehydrogenase
MDFVQRGYERSCKFVGEKGTILWSYQTNEVKMFDAIHDRWRSIPYDFEPNDMYIQEVKEFIHCVQTEESPMVTIEQAQQVLDVILASKEAALSGVTQMHYERYA